MHGELIVSVCLGCWAGGTVSNFFKIQGQHSKNLALHKPLAVIAITIWFNYVIVVNYAVVL